MLYTSYFKKKDELLNMGFSRLISIAGVCPTDFLSTHLNDNRCLEYRKLAPKYSWWKIWHDNQLSSEWYTEKYYETVLNLLNPIVVYQHLTKNNTTDAVLLCWEEPFLFCHRHIVADWLMKNIQTIYIEEI
jgi:hypothetical protein